MSIKKGLFVTLTSALLLAGCQEQASTEGTPVTIPVVKTIALSNLSVQPQWSLTGTISARYTSNLAFRVGGKITQRLVNSGDSVKPGQALFKLDPTDYQLALDVILADIRATEAQIHNAKLELERFKKLLQRSLTAQQNVDQAQSNLTVLEERLKSLTLQEKQARNQLEYTSLESPGLGKILKVQAEEGEVVATGYPVASIALAGEREVVVQVPESRIQTLPMNAQVKIYGSERLLNVKLREREASADALSRTWTARYRFEEGSAQVQHYLESLNLGQTATLFFESVGNLIKVPNSALYEQGDFVSIWQVKDNHVKRLPVKIKSISEESAWIEGDFSDVSHIVSLGVHQLNEGQAVKESLE
ncbi:hemolysin secretion protein D [Thiomicrorhabdus immobilis]|uniref:Hemolysin secretion protein D n=1 Tax=Thiomicrorhabdus immobilis TaxID=2791037 RepID=A0ABM7MG30_9GAMM|nr:efflux RND transporter periplasmic adaptor subunit [Thiomicrorhabdus immobilis]BCN94459.1 hemolysin secretion protein D [Thiomicrorhabdus immobilis]